MTAQVSSPVQVTSSIKPWLVQWISKELNLSATEIDTSKSLLEYSLSSMTAMMLVGELEDLLGIEISPTLVWDYPCIDLLAEYLDSESQKSPKALQNNPEPSSVNVDELSEEELDALLGNMLS
jgi:acyl carrier protein